jgi:hypothetical protein
LRVTKTPDFSNRCLGTSSGIDGISSPETIASTVRLANLTKYSPSASEYALDNGYQPA